MLMEQQQQEALIVTLPNNLGLAEACVRHMFCYQDDGNEHRSVAVPVVGRTGSIKVPMRWCDSELCEIKIALFVPQPYRVDTRKIEHIVELYSNLWTMWLSDRRDVRGKGGCHE